MYIYYHLRKIIITENEYLDYCLLIECTIIKTCVLSIRKLFPILAISTWFKIYYKFTFNALFEMSQKVRALPK